MNNLQYTGTIIAGPTASGKSTFAIRLAKYLKQANAVDCVIINADSQQIYKGLEVLCANPSINDMLQVEHRLYGFLDIGTQYSVNQWLDDVMQEIRICEDMNKYPIIVGGTGLYLQALLEGLAILPARDYEWDRCMLDVYNSNNTCNDSDLYKCDDICKSVNDVSVKKCSTCVNGVSVEKCSSYELQELVKYIDVRRKLRALYVYRVTGKWPYEHQRISTNICTDQWLKLYVDRMDLDRRIMIRLNRDLDAIIAEFRLLKDKLNGKTDKICQIIQALGVQQLMKYEDCMLTYVQLLEQLFYKTRQYAKRQRTWFKKYYKSNMQYFKEISDIELVNISKNHNV